MTTCTMTCTISSIVDVQLCAIDTTVYSAYYIEIYLFLPFSIGKRSCYLKYIRSVYILCVYLNIHI